MTQLLRSRPSRGGFTLTELLAALTLTVLLMGSVLGMLTVVHRAQREVLEQHGIPAPWEVQLEEILAWDLENSRSIVVTESGVRLDGFAGRDLSTRAPLHCPARVEYEIVSVKDRRHLIRRETHVELLHLDNSLTELVCADVTQIRMGAPRAPGRALAQAEATKTLPNGPLPERLSVTLVGGTPPTVLFTRNFQR